MWLPINGAVVPDLGYVPYSEYAQVVVAAQLYPLDTVRTARTLEYMLSDPYCGVCGHARQARNAR